MKLEHYQLHDISNILAIPKTTLRDRFSVIGIYPIEKKRIGRVTKHYYSKTQLESIKEYFASYNYIRQPKAKIDLVKGYEIENGVCIITVQSVLNFMH